MAAIPVIKPSFTSLAMDQSDPLGNSTDVFARQALHVKVGNSAAESIPVYLTDANGLLFTLWNEVTAVAASIETTVVTYIVPLGKTTKIQIIEIDGDNIALYRVKLDSITIAQKHMWWIPGLNGQFNFGGGLELAAGQTIEVTVIHERPYVGSFNSRVQGIEADV